MSYSEILLIDDEEHRALNVARLMKEPLGWAHTGPIGEEALRSQKFKKLLLDHDLYCQSGMSGQDIARIVLETQDPLTCEIFIHSQNKDGARAMADTLCRFKVTISPWDNARGTAEGLAEFLTEVPVGND